MIEAEDIRVCVVGLGYVGLPLACLFATRYPTVGYDINVARVSDLNQGRDSTQEVEDDRLVALLSTGQLHLTYSETDIKSCNVYVVAVPTPVDDNNRPDLTPLISASEVVGRAIDKGDVVIYESTVYPGVTEEVCLPVVAQESGLHLNEHFFAGYSPERINPGDRQHRVETICKVTSGSTPETAEWVDVFYRSVLKNGTHKAPSIRVAEASKIVENTQRDVNIAFVNELSKIFDAMGIDTHDVLEAASSKWNFIPMQPGLVGGHCISVDPYYLIERSQLYGVMPRVMMNARRLNNSMGTYVATRVIHQMNLKGLMVRNARILILGFSFKENCPDIRNTKVIDIYRTLREYSTRITVCDPWVDVERVRSEYGMVVNSHLPDASDAPYDVAVLAVAHDCFRHLDLRQIVPQPGVIYDVKGILPRTIIDSRL